MLDKAEISKVPSQKRLGVSLYRNMAYDSHVDDLCKKLSKQIKPLSTKKTKNADRKTLSITLYFTKQSLIKRLTLSYNQLDNNFSTPICIDSLLLIRNSDIHQRDTRYSDLNLLCPKYTKKTEGGRTTVRTIAEWNAFDQSIRKKLSIASFKRALYKTS